MPQFDPSTLPSQLAWLFVAFVVMYVAMSQLALPRVAGVVNARAKKIDDDLAEARRLRAEAEAILATTEKGLAEARTQAAARTRAATEAAHAASAAKLAAATQQLDAKTADSLARIEAARQSALAELKPLAAELAAEMTQRLTGARPAPARVEAALAGHA